jgi:hypothetical protein
MRGLEKVSITRAPPAQSSRTGCAGAVLNLVSSTGWPGRLQNLPGLAHVQLPVQNSPSGLAALDVPTPPPLESPSALVHYSLESPWALGALLVLAAAVAPIASKRENRAVCRVSF